MTLADVLRRAIHDARMPAPDPRTANQLVRAMDLPGVDTDSIDLEVERNVLTVKATRRELEEAKQREAVVSERPAGVFSRQVFLGDTLDADNINATYADGVLTLRIPVAEHASPARSPSAAAAAPSRSHPDPGRPQADPRPAL
jgi:HSP20 family protein